MNKSIPKLEEISTLLSQHQTYYTFTKMEDNSSNKYKKGRIGASKWLNELIYYYFKKEESFICEFKENLVKQKKELNTLKDGDYKKGLFDEFNLIEDILNEYNNCNK